MGSAVLGEDVLLLEFWGQLSSGAGCGACGSSLKLFNARTVRTSDRRLCSHLGRWILSHWATREAPSFVFFAYCLKSALIPGRLAFLFGYFTSGHITALFKTFQWLMIGLPMMFLTFFPALMSFSFSDSLRFSSWR